MPMLLNVFFKNSIGFPFKCCYNNVIVPCGYSSLSPVTWKRLPSLALRNDFRESNAGELPEVMATVGGCSDCWKLQRVAGEARNMTENALSILIVIFPYNSNKPRAQTESCVFSKPGP